MTLDSDDAVGGSDDVDRQIIDLFVVLMESFKEHFVAALESADLGMSHGHVLMCLDEPMPMNALAKRMGFDASHITAIIDRLEQRNLIERRPDPRDRRIKRIAITDDGAALRDAIRGRLLDTLPPLSRLTLQQRTQLRDLLATAIPKPPRAPAGLGPR